MRGLLVVFALTCLAVAAWMGAHPAREVGARDLRDGTSLSAPDVPPGVRFVSVALGGFRGLLADVLWVKAADLQDEGNFFEVAQLSEWIVRLEPTYPEVWAYHAWNLAYNIPAVIPSPTDRWHWVRHGLRLLRDEGIPANPGNPKLYWELGWLFYDKVGGRWDEATLTYRIKWALEMVPLVPGGMMDYGAVDKNPGLAKMLGAAGLDPRIMKAVDESYGPLDWRLPESQAIYWGYCGRPYQEADSRWCDRLVWMGVLQSVKGGALAFSPERQLYQQAPRLDLAVKGIRRCAADRLYEGPLTRNVAVTFLRESAVYLYAFGRSAEARAALTELRRVPDSGTFPESLEAFIRQDIAAQMEALDKPGRVERILSLLVRGDVWRRLEVPLFADGFERLAKLYWDAGMKRDPGLPAWDGLRQEAGARAGREMPGPVRTPPQSP